MKWNYQNTDPQESDNVTWLASEIFKAFPQECTGLKLYSLDCRCIYYQRGFWDGNLSPQTGIYRDATDGPCDVCVRFPRGWKDRVVDEIVVYK